MPKATKSKTRKPPARKGAAGEKEVKGPLSAEERHRMIAEAAYFKALERGPGNPDPEGDWYAAEAMIDAKYPAGAKGARKTGLEDPRSRKSPPRSARIKM